MPVACLCGHGPQALIEMSGQVPAISPKWIRQIGIRSVDEGEKRFVHEQDLEVFDMRYIDEMGMRAAMELALALALVIWFFGARALRGADLLF
jgi:arginase